MRYGRTELYRLYEDGDWTGALLYVGITHDYWRGRRLDHRRAYGVKVAHQPLIVDFASRREAEIAEVTAQFHERPRDGKYPTDLRDLDWAIKKIERRYVGNVRDSDPLADSPTYVLTRLLEGHNDGA